MRRWPSENAFIMHFEAKLSGAVKGITVVFVILLSAIVIAGIYFSVKELFVGDVKIGGVGFIYAVLFTTGMGFLAVRDRVSGYSISADRLEIYRPWQEDEIISLKGLEAAECAINPLRKAIMVGATGGVCGFYGDFKQIGGQYFTAYVTDPKCCAMLHMKGDERIVISPHERERFLATLAALRPDVQVKTV